MINLASILRFYFILTMSIIVLSQIVFSEETFIIEYNIPTDNSGPIGIVADSKGWIWFAENNVSRITKFNLVEEKFVEYQLPLFSQKLVKGTQIWGMVFDIEENLWFCEASEAAIWKFNTIDENFERFLLQPSTVFPIQLAFDLEGNLWFTELFGDRIGLLKIDEVINNSYSGVYEYLIPSSKAGATGLTFDKSGKLWFTESFSKKIASFDPVSKEFVEYSMPTSAFAPVGIVYDLERRFWITDHGSSLFYQFDPLSKKFTEYCTSESDFFSASLPYYIVVDSQGKIWMNEHYGNVIASMDPKTQILTEYKIPTQDIRFGNISNALYLTVDGEDRIWFTEWTSNKIGFLQTNLSIPFDFELSERKILLNNDQEYELLIKLKNVSIINGALIPYVSGNLSPSGNVDSLQITFDPPALTSNSNQSRIILKSNGTIASGEYTLMVGGRYQNITRLLAVELIVENSIIANFNELWLLFLIVLSPTLIIILYLFMRKTNN